MKEFKPQGEQIDIEGLQSVFLENYEGCLSKTKDLIELVDAEYVFQSIVAEKLSEAVGGYKESEHGANPALVELAAFYLYPCFGRSQNRSSKEVQAVIDAISEVNQFRIMAAAFNVDRSNKKISSIQVHLRIYAETVRGSSYPAQIQRRIEKIQGPFEGWFKTKCGIGPLRAITILNAAEEALNESFQASRKEFHDISSMAEKFALQLTAMPLKLDNADLSRQRLEGGERISRFMEEMPLAFCSSFKQIDKIVDGLTREEWDGLCNLIGLTPELRMGIVHTHEMKDRPVYFLSKDRLVLVDTSSAYDALFEALDKVTRTNLAFRDAHYVPNLSSWMEDETVVFLQRLFPSAAVFKSLLYSDPDRPGGEAELDAAVVWGPFIIVVEIKGKQFRPRSRLGDPARLRDDLKDSIEEAFDQAKRAIRFIEGAENVDFVEKASGRKLTLQKSRVRRIFPVSITLHHFGGLATQLALLKGIGLFKDSNYPWSVSLADLDIVTKFCQSPDIFLHYIQRRIDLQRSEKHIMGDELDVFGHYLDTRLHPDELWNRKNDDGSTFDRMMLTGGSEKFDDWFQAEAGIIDNVPDIRPDLPPNFLGIITALRQRDDDGARWIVFALLGLSQQAVHHIEKDIARLRLTEFPKGKIGRITHRDGDVVISILCANGLTTDELRRQTDMRAGIEKYRLKTFGSVAIGIDSNDMHRPFDYACWMEGEWKRDEGMEEIMQMERPHIFPGQSLPGRNNPCFCGSGKKFKKCCLNKVG